MRSIVFRLILIGLLMLGGAAVSAQPSDDLVGTQWQLVAMGGTPLPEQVVITLLFADDAQASGMGGCNGYGATYTVDGSALQLTDIVSTLMACDLLDYEVAYFAALQTVTEYELSDGELVLTSADGELVFTALPTLPGTAWQLIWLDGAEVRGDEPLTLEFAEDGTAHGNGGCNRFNTEFTVNGDQLAFAPLMSTRRACVDADGNAQENDYFTILVAAANYTITDNHLTIIANDGRMLRFELVENLAETAWQLESLDGTAVSGTVTLEFTDEARVAGSGGCNQFSGSYTVDDQAISFGELVTTERACTETGLMEQEALFYAALSAATGFEQADDQLIITYGDDQQLIFSAASTISTGP